MRSERERGHKSRPPPDCTVAETASASEETDPDPETFLWLFLWPLMVMAVACLVLLYKEPPLVRFLRRRPTSNYSSQNINHASMRPFARPQLRQAVPSTRQCLARQTHNKARRVFSSSSTVHAADASPPANHLAAFGSLPSELDRIAPRFAIDARDIQILREPKEFYAVLKVCLRLTDATVLMRSRY